MFVSETKRKVYDQDGSLYKYYPSDFRIDILRSMRRKDVPASGIQDEGEDNSNNLNIKQEEENGKARGTMVLKWMLMVVLLIVIGVWRVGGNGGE